MKKHRIEFKSILKKKALLVNIFLFFLMVVSCQNTSGRQVEKELLTDSIPSFEKLKKAIDSVMLIEMEENHIPGMAIVLVKDGKTVYKKGHGIASLINGKKVDPDKTIFRIGSISKALTLLTLTKLIDDGRIGIDDDVTQYFTGIQNPNNFKDPVRIYNLLTHTSGFDQVGLDRHVYDYELPLEERKAKRPTINTFLKANNLRRVTPAGAYYRYDTYGTTLAGAIIEKVTGLPYAAAMKKELFDPIGMSRSFVEVATNYRDSLALGHGYNNEEYQGMPYEVYVTTPASSIDATPADMGRLMEVLTNQGTNENGRLFSPEMTHKILKPQYRPNKDFVGMTHGMQESVRIGSGPDAYTIRTVGHGGDMLGMTSAMTLIPSLNMGVFVTANRNGEAGGDPVRLNFIMNTLLKHLGYEKGETQYEIPKKSLEVDLEDYTGNYYFGVFCHSCNEEEFERGAWRRTSQPIAVSVLNDTLMLGEDKYIAKGDDIFIREDGNEMVYFGRNKNNKITFLNFSDGNSPLERIED